MSFPTQILPDHHRHCDDLFVAAENAVQRGDWAAAGPACAHFSEQMQAHFIAEEDLLFPAFESASGNASGPTRVMRMEHEQMRLLLVQLEAACGAHDADAYAGAAETLLILMQQHNMKEENILYPMCDQALGPEAERIAAQMSATLEKAGA